MGLFDWIKGVTFIEVIEWTDDSGDTLVYRFPTYDKAIKLGAQLTVREGQQAIFVKEGRLADVFAPGRYTLTTKNLPILQGLIGLPFGAQTPFKAEVYFISMREVTGLKWGTSNPIIMPSPDFGPVRVRGFGTFTVRVKDPVAMLRKLVGTDARFGVGEILDQLRSFIVKNFADTVAEGNYPILQLASNYRELSDKLLEEIQEEFSGYGLEVPRFVIENITLPEEVEQALDQRSKMGVLGDLDKFTKLKAAEAIGDAAKNPGGAGDAMGMGVGFVLAQQMAKQLNQPSGGAAAAASVSCAHCGTQSPPGRFCSNCGKPLAQATGKCQACKRDVPSDSKFCPDCGAKVL
ncbi:MAG TPA: SPFH domain-containing protein [Planctomycetota bacterium]|nr:SPFH domain-containing protein [Planctomycetota bacterium]